MSLLTREPAQPPRRETVDDETAPAAPPGCGPSLSDSRARVASASQDFNVQHRYLYAPWELAHGRTLQQSEVEDGQQSGQEASLIFPGGECQKRASKR